MRKLALLFCMTIVAAFGYTQNSSGSKNEIKSKGIDAITEDAVKGQLEFLASDWTEGRETGKPGGFMAADYIASMFKVYGLKPAGDMSRPSYGSRSAQPNQPVQTYFQDFNLVETKAGEIQKLELLTSDGISTRSIMFNNEIDFNLFLAETGYEINAPVVFVGYGIVNPDKGIDELKNLNIKGKIVLRLMGDPTLTELPANQTNNRRGGAGNVKDKVLIQKGALAVLDISSEMQLQTANFPFHYKSSSYEGDKMPESRGGRLRFIEDTLSSNLKSMLVSKRVAIEILRGSGIDLEAYKADAINKKFQPIKSLTGVTIHIVSSVITRVIKARNVIGMIEGENPEEYVIVGGHYDHLGIQNGFIFNGADDNASGSVGVMTIAKAFMATGIMPKKSIIFALWTGEEKGLLGSDFFASRSGFKNKNILFYQNFDMISRNSNTETDGKTVDYNYTKSIPLLEEISKKNMAAYNLDLNAVYTASEKPRGGSDFTAFTNRNIPVIAAMAAMHPDYHMPTDELLKVNYPKMINIIKLGFLNLWDIAELDSLK